MKKSRISLFIIAKNEESKIAKCILSTRGLESEVIVVNSFSKDKTALVCRELGAQVTTARLTDLPRKKITRFPR